jgi:hypothetical protein
MKRLVALAFCLFGQLLAQNCMLKVPQNALTATGLSTPYIQTGCQQAGGTPSFVNGVILDSQAITLSVYNPLVIDQGTQPAVAPVVPILPQQSVVALWFGTNGNSLTLVDNGGSLQGASCTNGIINPATGLLDIFGQFAYCNAIAFFVQAKAFLTSGALVAPPLGVAIDGQPCPTIRSFFIVDQDQSDNVNTVYIQTQAGTIAQNTTANFQKFAGTASFLMNGSDNLLLILIDRAIGCTPWMAPDLADPVFQAKLAAPGLNELHAEKYQKAPVALVPLNDAMAKVNNQPSLQKVNAWRQGTGQTVANTAADADQVNYCFNMYLNFPIRLLKLMGSLVNFPSPDAAAADSLYTFLAQRFVAAFGDQNMGCFDKLQIPRTLPPVIVKVNAAGMVVGAIITPPNNGPTNPIYAATTAAAAVQNNNNNKAGTTAKGWSTGMIVGVVVGAGVGVLVIIGFIVAFRAHKVRNFFSGVRDGIATKMRN